MSDDKNPPTSEEANAPRYKSARCDAEKVSHEFLPTSSEASIIRRINAPPLTAEQSRVEREFSLPERNPHVKNDTISDATASGRTRESGSGDFSEISADKKISSTQTGNVNKNPRTEFFIACERGERFSLLLALCDV